MTVLFLRNTYLPRMSVPEAPRGAEPVRFHASDGLWLSGWTLRAREDAPWIILCHGLGTNRADLWDIAQGLHAAGFRILMFDFRAHGESEGRATSFGWLERRDLEGALAFLGSQDADHDHPYGVFGLSMGAAAAIMVAAEDERVAAIAVDTPYHNLEDSLALHARLLYRLPRWPFVPMMALVYRVRFGVWPAQMSPIDAVEQISPRPLLIIHGEDDPRMPSSTIQALAARVKPPVEVWTVPGAAHLGGYRQEAGEYLRRLVTFFTQALILQPAP